MDLKKTSTLISKYELEIENGSDLTEPKHASKSTKLAYNIFMIEILLCFSSGCGYKLTLN